MHHGLCHFVDEPLELYEARAWTASNRTTSGEFAHVLTEEADEVEPVFASDFVLYCCLNEECICQGASLDELSLAHIGCVYTVGRDHRSNHCMDKPSEITLQIQEAFGQVDCRNEGLIPKHCFAGQDNTFEVP